MTISRFIQFPTITETPRNQSMDEILANLQKHFPSLPQNAILKIYKSRAERMRLLMSKGIPNDLRWIIEARVRLAGEYSYVSYMPGFGKSTYSRKRRAKSMGVCYKCARMTCNTRCKTLGMMSDNREDKIKVIKDGLSKESLDDIESTLETHPSGYVHLAIHVLHAKFQKEHSKYSLGNLTLKDPVCQFIRKLDGKHILDP